MKTGIFGGSFDPPHMGHIQIALMSKEKFALDRIIMVPAGQPPHKETAGALHHRYNMCKMLSDKYGFEISDYEINKKTFCYSFETLEYFRKLYPDDELYFIIGGDSMKNFGKWKNPQRITELCNLIVASRDDGTREAAEEAEKIYNTKIYLLDNENIDVSSTEIRNIINGDGDAKGIEPEILNYITENNLYR